MEQKNKTNTDRIKKIYKLAEEHFGDVKFVGIKYDKEDGWVAKIDLPKPINVDSIKVHHETSSTEALKKLKLRMKKIIRRYNGV